MQIGFGPEETIGKESLIEIGSVQVSPYSPEESTSLFFVRVSNLFSFTLCDSLISVSFEIRVLPGKSHFVKKCGETSIFFHKIKTRIIDFIFTKNS